MKYIYTFLFIAISAMSFAQGNLQFNKVLNFDYPSVYVAPGGTVLLETINVPSGKVWKITAASSSVSSSSSSDYRSSLAVNSHYLFFHPSRDNAIMNTPFWLSSGVHEFKVTNEYQPGFTSSAISVIEFNIVP